MQADLWSVGAILFQLVTGKPPFDGSNQLQVLRRQTLLFSMHYQSLKLKKKAVDIVIVLNFGATFCLFDG